MSGRLTHEVNVRPTYNADYSGRMRARIAAATEPTRQIKRIEESMAGARGNINMLSSGANQRTSSFDSLVVRSAHTVLAFFNSAHILLANFKVPSWSAHREVHAYGEEPTSRPTFCLI